MSRLDLLPPYLFSALDAAKARAVAAGVDVVDLGIGDPDLPTPRPLLEVMATAVRDTGHHRYPAQRGSAALRRAIASYMQRRHGVTVDPDTQILVLVGSKEGLGHLPMAFLEEGDRALIPDLGYPVYGQATLLAGGTPTVFPLPAERDFLPDPDLLSSMADERTRLLFLNYPNNPTGAVADPEFWREMVGIARRKNLVLVNDAAYLEVTLDGTRPVSLLPHADLDTDRVVELHSLSKMFNMTGWRVAFAVGNAEVVGALGRVKESMDSGVFGAIQETAAFALGDACDGLLAEVMAVYGPRRSVVLQALQKAGVEVFPSPATFYVWARVPGGQPSVEFCSRVLDEIGVVVTPGNGFGPGGEGWFRISLTAADEAVAEGAKRLWGVALMDMVSLHGIDVYAHHGVHPAERELGQRFVIDVDLWVDCSAAAESDALTDALDYTAVHRAIREATADTSFQLIEALAGHLCVVLLGAFPVERIRLQVLKPNPPIPNFLGEAAVTLQRDRAWFAARPGGSR